jgi:hypothetical protein
MMPIGECFLYTVPEEATRGFVADTKALAWRTNTPGLIVTAQLFRTLGFRLGCIVTHEPTGFGLLVSPQPIEKVVKVIECANRLREIALPWETASVIELYSRAATLPDDDLLRIHGMLHDAGLATPPTMEAVAKTREMMRAIQENLVQIVLSRRAGASALRN